MDSKDQKFDDPTWILFTEILPMIEKAYGIANYYSAVNTANDSLDSAKDIREKYHALIKKHVMRKCNECFENCKLTAEEYKNSMEEEYKKRYSAHTE